MRNAALVRRDPGLPVALGDRFVPPGPDELAELAVRHLARSAVEVADCVWTAARWKPGVSLSCTYALHTADGEELQVAWKSYAGDKGAERAQRDPEEAGDDAPWAPQAFLPDGRTLLTRYPHDPRLPGLSETADARRSARLVELWGLAPPRTVRRRRTDDTLVRYKPERRAVLKRVFRMRPPARLPELALGWRVLVPEAARRTIAARLVFESVRGTLRAPLLRAVLPAAGVLVEDWVDATALEPEDFSAARETGAVLARLHALPLHAEVPAADPYDPAGDRELLHLAPRLASVVLPEAPRAASGPTWVHGDFHPDHVARGDGEELLLLDLDELGSGDPARDLASWIADRDASEVPNPGADVAELLAGYEEHGSADVLGRVQRHVAAELHARAAGALRRLEVDAVDRAARLLALATGALCAGRPS